MALAAEAILLALGVHHRTVVVGHVRREGVLCEQPYSRVLKALPAACLLPAPPARPVRLSTQPARLPQPLPRPSDLLHRSAETPPAARRCQSGSSL